jgi:hypothetical protein
MDACIVQGIGLHTFIDQIAQFQGSIVAVNTQHLDHGTVASPPPTATAISHLREQEGLVSLWNRDGRALQGRL